jgi:hypothetical protein
MKLHILDEVFHPDVKLQQETLPGACFYENGNDTPNPGPNAALCLWNAIWLHLT